MTKKRSDEDIAGCILEEMELDNDVPIPGTWNSPRNRELLSCAIERLRRNGCRFSPKQIRLLASGEEMEQAMALDDYDGFYDLNHLLNWVFASRDVVN